MDIHSITTALDNEFTIQKYKSDSPFSYIFPLSYKQSGIQIENYVEEIFLKRCNGLMIKNSSVIEKIYLSVFLSKEVLDYLFNSNNKQSLLFVHHPMEDETSNRGFIPLSVSYLEKLKECKISVYSLHTPLDLHPNVSTSKSFAKKLGLSYWQNFDGNAADGYYGVLGTLEQKQDFDSFITKVKQVCELETVRYIEKHDTVNKIAVIAGGGTDLRVIREAIDLGADTFVTGEYVSGVNTEECKKERQKFYQVADSLPINFIGASHYASEKIVLKNEVIALFEKFNVPVEFIDQKDPWY